MPPEQLNGEELDLRAFKGRLQAAREFTVEIGAMQLRCVLPQPIEQRLVRSRYLDETGSSGERWLHELAIGAVVGWQGVHVRDVAPSDKHGERELPWSAEKVRLLLSERLDVNDAVGLALIDRLQARQAQLEADAKNSASALTGSDPGTKREESPTS